MDPLFPLRTAIILSVVDSTRYWKHFSEILVHVDIIAWFVCQTVVADLSTVHLRSNSPVPTPRYSVGLRSFDCGGQLSTVNSSLRCFELFSAGGSHEKTVSPWS